VNSLLGKTEFSLIKSIVVGLTNLQEAPYNVLSVFQVKIARVNLKKAHLLFIQFCVKI